METTCVNHNLVNKYTLRCKDKPLVSFSLYADKLVHNGKDILSYSIEITHNYNENEELLPKNLPAAFTAAQLLAWISKRKAPKNRQFVDKLMLSIEDDANPLK